MDGNRLNLLECLSILYRLYKGSSSRPKEREFMFSRCSESHLKPWILLFAFTVSNRPHHGNIEDRSILCEEGFEILLLGWPSRLPTSITFEAFPFNGTFPRSHEIPPDKGARSTADISTL